MSNTAEQIQERAREVQSVAEGAIETASKVVERAGEEMRHAAAKVRQAGERLAGKHPIQETGRQLEAVGSYLRHRPARMIAGDVVESVRQRPKTGGAMAVVGLASGWLAYRWFCNSRR